MVVVWFKIINMAVHDRLNNVIIIVVVLEFMAIHITHRWYGLGLKKKI